MFDLEKDKPNFNTWKSKWEWHIKGAGFEKLNEPEKSESLRSELQKAMSDDTIRWVDNQGFSNSQMDDAKFIIVELEKYIKGTTNPLVQVVELITKKKLPNETFEYFVTAIKEKAKLCEFDKIENVADYFQVLCLCANSDSTEVRKKLLLEKDLNFQRAIEICYQEEKAVKTSQQLAGSGDPSISKVSTYKGDRRKQQQDNQTQQQQDNNRDHSNSRSGERSRERSQWSNNYICYRCGQENHKSSKEECKALNSECYKCWRIGHYGKMCRSQESNAKSVLGNATPQANTLVMNAISVASNQVQPLELISVKFIGPNGVESNVKALPDSGSNITAMSPEDVGRMGNAVKGEKIVLQPKSADGSSLEALTTLKFDIVHGNQRVNTDVYVISGLEKPVLSIQVLKGLKMIPAEFPHTEKTDISKRTPAIGELKRASLRCTEVTILHQNNEDKGTKVKPLLRPAMPDPARNTRQKKKNKEES